MDFLPTLKGESVQMETRYKGGKLMTATSYFKGFYRGLGRPDLYRAIAELGQFFRELCSRNIRIDALERLRDKIPTILCDLEMIYPPAFFDAMVHLAMHLPDEALLLGPV